MATNQNITQLTPQVGSANTTSLFYAVINGNTDTNLPISVFVNNLGLTGIPTAPTAASGTNTTQIASTAFVQTAVSGGAYAGRFTNLSASGTVTFSNPLTVPNGGTGLSTITAFNLVAGNGVSAVQLIAPGSAGSILTSNGPSALPSFQAQPALAGRLLNIQVFTNSGTYTPTTGMTSCLVMAIGGGGGGAGCPATAAGQSAVGGGGAAGGRAFVKFTSVQIGASQSVTIGAAGTGGTSGNGGAGGSTSVGSLLTVTGGNGGVSVGPTGGIALTGTAAGGSVTANTASATIWTAGGSHGGQGAITSANALVWGGPGANGLDGAGQGQASNQGNGIAATGYGAGGGGAATGPGSGGQNGGAGFKGLVVIYEYA